MPIIDRALLANIMPTEDDQDVLMKLATTVTELATESDPEQALEKLENAMRFNSRSKATAESRMWYILMDIIKPLELWKYHRVFDPGSETSVQKFNSFEQYAMVTMAEIDKVSSSTVAKRSELFGKLKALGLEADDILEALEHPSATMTMMSVLDFEPDTDGGYEFHGITPDARDGVRQQLGWTPQEGGDDRMVARDLVRQAGSTNARNVIAKAIGEWLHQMEYDEDEHSLVLTTWDPNGKGRETATFVLNHGVDLSECPHIRKKLEEWKGWGRQDGAARQSAKKRRSA